ncbi:uncharacterized protein TNCV_4876851 [Trichonephila clavipes]|nr:uncharacterized protein TNCV_4876851 [Trichonephila clavipes]
MEPVSQIRSKFYNLKNDNLLKMKDICKNRLRLFTLRLTGGAHRYHCSRRKQKPTFDVNKTLTGGAQRTSLNQSPGDQSRGFSTADSLRFGTCACAVLAIRLRCQSMFRYFTARLEILTLKLGEWGATSVVLLVTRLKFQITRSLSVEFVTNPSSLQILLSPDTRETKVPCPSSVDLPSP